MLRDLRTKLHTECQLDLKKPVLVGVSGGADSLCLMDVLWRLRFPLIIAHYNHKLRPESDLAANQVEVMATKLNLEFVLGVGDVDKVADDENLSVEEAARIMRYGFLFNEAKRLESQAVVVGHNADDQVETILMHLLRGSGLKGLTGMPYRMLPSPWSKNIPLVRPMLGIWRDDILLYLAERQLQPILDKSNLDTTLNRNRLRYELIPYLEEFNPKIRQALLKTINVLQEDYVVLDSMIQEAWQDCLLEQGAGYVGFDIHLLKEKPVGLQRHIYRRAIAALIPDMRDIDFELIGRAVAFLKKPAKTRKKELTEQVQLLLEGKCLWVFLKDAPLPVSEWPQVLKLIPVELTVPGKLNMSDNWIMQAARMVYDDRIKEQIFSNADPFKAYIDACKLKSKLIVRNRQPGDRFSPLGMKGRSMKLADFMVNEKILKRAREKWPLVCDGDEILWVPGYSLGHYSCVSERTTEIIRLSLVRQGHS
jgi:tRNA(Ile)-lysidine synthase